MPVDREKLEKFKRGELKLGQVFDFDTKQVAALMVTGYTLFTEGRLEEARIMFQGLAILDGRNAYVHGILGAISQKQGKDEEAVQHYTTALNLFPQDMYSLTNRGEIYLKLGRFKEAAADLKTVINLDPEKKHPAANRARLMVALTQEALKLARDKGVQAVFEAKKHLESTSVR